MELGYSFGSHYDTPKVHSIEKYLRDIGHLAIKSRNSDDHNISYASQALLQEVIENNAITTMYLNDERSKTGKFSQPSEPCNLMKMLLKSRIEIQKKSIDIKLVPVHLEYERVIDLKDLITNQGKCMLPQDSGLLMVMRKLMQTPKERLGKCIVRYGEPIDFDAYIKQNFIENLEQNPKMFFRERTLGINMKD